MKWITAKDNIRPLSEKKYAIKWNGDSLSFFQFNVKQFFKKYWKDDVVGEEVLLPQTRLRVDLMNFSRKIAVEVNGLFHVEYTPYFQNSVERSQQELRVPTSAHQSPCDGRNAPAGSGTGCSGSH